MDRSRIDTVETTRAPGDEASWGRPRVALWMVHHVDDRDRAIGELARVLRPGGRLVATGNGRGHLAELWALIGFEYPGSPFGRENGRAGDTAVFVADR